VAYLDNDNVNKPHSENAAVYALEGTGPLSTEDLSKKHPKVFGEGVGLLKGRYHIRL